MLRILPDGIACAAQPPATQGPAVQGAATQPPAHTLAYPPDHASTRSPHQVSVQVPVQVPALPGAYALLLALDRPAEFAIRGTHIVLACGWYAYVGSARGPGGLKARIDRHLRPDKAIHWHIDRLTGRAAMLRALAVPDGRECALGKALVTSGMFDMPVPGFGSSDCRRCTSHLLRWIKP